MLINGCLVNNDCVDDDVVLELFQYLDLDDKIENEALATIGGDFEVYEIDGDDNEFTLTYDGEEYRVIHDNYIESVYANEAEDVYDVDMWREDAGSNNGTTQSYDDWFQDVLDEGDYGSFFGSYDGRENSFGDYRYFRVN